MNQEIIDKLQNEETYVDTFNNLTEEEKDGGFYKNRYKKNINVLYSFINSIKKSELVQIVKIKTLI